MGGLRPDRGEQSRMMFQWLNWPLIQAMMEGGVFLAVEIILAEDLGLKRMNSVLMPERVFLLSEKIGQEVEGMEGTTEKVVAKETFRFVGIMNPGGDYDKKELSPALKNRFTEIWCPALSIIERKIGGDVVMEGVGDQVVEG